MPAVLPKYTQAPADVLDYPVDWLVQGLAPGETISSASFSAPGLTIVAQQASTTNATVWLTGGTVGVTYTVKCEVLTSAGRTDDQSLMVAIADPVLPMEYQSPTEVRDHPLDWSPVLAAGEVISSATFTVPTGLTLVSQSATPSTATVRLSGGTLGSPAYTVGCRIVTNQARTYNGGFKLRIVPL